MIRVIPNMACGLVLIFLLAACNEPRQATTIHDGGRQEATMDQLPYIAPKYWILWGLGYEKADISKLKSLFSVREITLERGPVLAPAQFIGSYCAAMAPPTTMELHLFHG